MTADTRTRGGFQDRNTHALGSWLLLIHDTEKRGRTSTHDLSLIISPLQANGSVLFTRQIGAKRFLCPVETLTAQEVMSLNRAGARDRSAFCTALPATDVLVDRKQNSKFSPACPETGIRRFENGDPLVFVCTSEALSSAVTSSSEAKVVGSSVRVPESQRVTIMHSFDARA